MSALRVCVIAAFVAVAAMASSEYTFGGCAAAPAGGSFFGNATVTCTKATKCQTDFCLCIGATAGANWTCTTPTTAPNCTTASTCLAAKVKCINAAADDSTCTALKKLKMSNLAVAGGQLYNASSAYMACKSEACHMLNQTAGNCTMDFNKLCASPVNFVGTLRLKGDFTKIFATAALKEVFKKALEKDLANALRILSVVITKMFLATKSRRAGDQTLIIEFRAEGVSKQNVELLARLASLKDTTWLKAALVEYKAVYGADATFGFLGIASGSSSSAVFSGASGSAATTASSTTTGSSGSSGSGASAQSFVAAVAVAIVGAMLF